MRMSRVLRPYRPPAPGARRVPTLQLVLTSGGVLGDQNLRLRGPRVRWARSASADAVLPGHRFGTGRSPLFSKKHETLPFVVAFVPGRPGLRGPGSGDRLSFSGDRPGGLGREWDFTDAGPFGAALRSVGSPPPPSSGSGVSAPTCVTFGVSMAPQQVHGSGWRGRTPAVRSALHERGVSVSVHVGSCQRFPVSCSDPAAPEPLSLVSFRGTCEARCHQRWGPPESSVSSSCFRRLTTSFLTLTWRPVTR